MPDTTTLTLVSANGRGMDDDYQELDLKDAVSGRAYGVFFETDNPVTAAAAEAARAAFQAVLNGLAPIPGLEPLVALSNLHLTQNTAALLTTTSDVGAIHYPNEHGAFVYVNPITGYRHPSDDLRIVLDWARERGVVWLKFDGDAGEIDGLPTYDWGS